MRKENETPTNSPPTIPAQRYGTLPTTSEPDPLARAKDSPNLKAI